MNKVLLALTAACALGTALPAAAQFRKPEDAIKYRQSTMTLLGAHFGRVAAMASGRAPFDAKAAADNAALVATLSRLPWSAFGEGTDMALPTRAKPEIWKEAAKFKESADSMVAEVAKLDAAAKSGNLDQIKAAVGAVGRSCKACHDKYQSDELK
jgi:cytochrome c556